MSYTEIQPKCGHKYYYRAKSVRVDDRFKKVRKYMGVDLSADELKQKELEMDSLLGSSFEGALKDEGVQNIRERLIDNKIMDNKLIVDVAELNNEIISSKEKEGVNPAEINLPAPSLKEVRKLTQEFNKSFHSKVFTLFASSESELYTFAKSFPVHYKRCVCFIKDDEGQWYLGEEDILKVRSWILEQAKISPQPLFELYNKWEKDWQRYLALEKKLREIDLKELDAKELYVRFKEFFMIYQRVGSIAYISDSFMSQGDEDWLEILLVNELKKLGKKDIESMKLVRKLTCPVHLSFTLEADYRLMKIAEKVLGKYGKRLPTFEQFSVHSSTASQKLFERLKHHEENFFWMHNNYYNVHYIDAKEFYEKIVEIINEANFDINKIRRIIKEKEAWLEGIKKEREHLMNELGLSRFTQNLLVIARLFIKWKDTRKAGVYIGMYHFDRFLDEVARRTEFTKEQLTYVIFDEIKDILDVEECNSPSSLHATTAQARLGMRPSGCRVGHLRSKWPSAAVVVACNSNSIKTNNLKAEILQRKQQCFFTFTDKGFFIVGGKKAEPYFNILKSQGTKNIVEIKGVVASPGYARGIVKIIRKTQEINEFKAGQILVTNQTTPEFLPAMKKASAIVTEQGGITSHAAIVSRELKKPCIIGTKIATTALKDNEIVEVDAERGIVRRER
jgi:phosphohistidine swiveling domain-containing protein